MSAPLRLAVGEKVMCRGAECEIVLLLGVTRFWVKPVAGSARPFAAEIADLSAVAEVEPPGTVERLLGADLEHTAAEHTNIAKRRLEIIEPLLEERTTEKVRQRAAEFGCSVTTIYRWINAYQGSERLSSLVPGFRDRGGRNKPRLAAGCEEIIQATINEYYLVPTRPSKLETATEVEARCRKAGIEPPSAGTVRNRILALSPALVDEARHGPKKARRRRKKGKGLPDVNRPWALVHVDHTELDVQVVDRETRQPIGRPFITLAEDAYSRVIVGVLISLDNPCSSSVGICLSHALLPKEAWLARRQLTGHWPVWGKPKVIHVDNAPEFHSAAFERACEELRVSIHWRRKGEPEDGARVERLIGTIGRVVHQLPGTTFSNPQERGEYGSEENAALTLDELERLVVDWIVNIYHQRGHSAHGGLPPMKVWEDGLLEMADLGLGLPMRHSDPEAIRLMFLPALYRTVQPTGVKLDGINYWHERLRHWIGSKEPGNQRLPRKFTFRRDPRDISLVWFFDPDLKTHIELSYADISRAPMSLWELRDVQRRLREEGAKAVNEDLIFATRERMREVAEQAIRQTKMMRRAREREQRRREGAAADRPAKPAAKHPPQSPPTAPPPTPCTQAAAAKPLYEAFEEIIF